MRLRGGILFASRTQDIDELFVFVTIHEHGRIRLEGGVRLPGRASRTLRFKPMKRELEPAHPQEDAPEALAPVAAYRQANAEAQAPQGAGQADGGGRVRQTAGRQANNPVATLIRRPVLIGAVVLALLVPAVAGAAEYDNFRSEVKSIAPAVDGLELEVVRGDEALRLRNGTGQTVLVEGYDGEDYLRFKRDGTVEANQRSAATFINVDRFGQREVPENTLPGAKPVWKRIADGGEHTWFDHRIHLTAKRPPARFTRQKEVTKVFNWLVPMSVDGRAVRATGELFWDPTASSDSSGGFPVWLAILIGVGVVAVLVLLLVRRSRRSPRPTDDEPAKEAW